MSLRGKITIFAFIALLIGVIYYVRQKPEITSTLGISTETASTSDKAVAKKASDLEIQDDAPLRVGVNIWPGFAPGFWFNKGAAANKSSQYYEDYRLQVEFKVVDDFQQSREMWKNDQIDVMWCTVDAFASEAEGLAQYGPQVFMKVDNSYGGDVVVATRDVATIAEARGQKWAFAPRTPSHTLTLWALQSGDLRESDIQVVPVDLAPVAADMFKKGAVNIATVWSPDDITCVQNVPGAHVLVSTKTASDIIMDGFIVKKSFISNPENFKKLQAFAEGWFRAVAALNSSESIRAEAAQILVMPFSASKEDMLAGIKNAKLSNYGDNVNFFGINNYRGMTGEKLYNHMVSEFAKSNYATSNAPSWRNISNASVIRSISMSGNDQRGEEAAVPFTPVTEKTIKTPGFANKKLTVNFPSGSFVITEKAKQIIDQQFVPYAQGFKYARIRVEGHTDDVGNRSLNLELSRQRAQAIINYLITEYGYDTNRFLPAVGYGPDAPLVPNTSETNRARNRRTEFELIQD